MSGVLAVALLFAFVHAMEIEAFGMAFAVGFLMYVSVLSGTVFGQGRNAG